MTNARELALELSQLPRAQREQLLAELPAERRAAMEALVAQIADLLSKAPQSFEQHMESAQAERSVQSFAGLNGGQLRLLLGAEPDPVQRRILAIVRNNYRLGFPAAVDSVVTNYLADRMQSMEIHGRGHASAPRRWWRRWKGAQE